MNFKGRFQGLTSDWATGQHIISFYVEEMIEGNLFQGVEALREQALDIKVVKYRKKRSKDANAMLWACIGDISSALRADKWEIYLQLLKRYGKYTYICVKPAVVESVKRQWRECEEIGEIEINGQKAIQLLCYFGSSTYDTQEFSVLLDGVISEMKEMGLETPPTKEMRRALEEWSKREKKVIQGDGNMETNPRL